MEQPKVLVGCPTYDGMDYCREAYARHVQHLHYPNYDVVLVDNSKDGKYKKKLENNGIKVIKDAWKEKPMDRVISSRNILRQYAIDNSYDYLLMLEQDVIPPQAVIEMLLRHSKPVVSGIYFKPFTLNIKFANKTVKRRELRPLLYAAVPGNPDKLHFCTKKDVAGSYLVKAAAAGLGCMLIHRDVFSQLSFRSDGTAYDDMFFCQDLRSKNIPLYADTSVKCRHLILKKPKQ